MKIFLSILSALVVLSLSCSSFAKTEDELQKECYSQLDNNIRNHLYTLVSQPGIAFIKNLYLQNNITLQDSDIVLQTISFDSIISEISLNYQINSGEYSEKIRVKAYDIQITYKNQPYVIDFLGRRVLSSNYNCEASVENTDRYNEDNLMVFIKANSETNKEYLGHIKIPTGQYFYTSTASVPRIQ